MKMRKKWRLFEQFYQNIVLSKQTNALELRFAKIKWEHLNWNLKWNQKHKLNCFFYVYKLYILCTSLEITLQ